MLLNFNIPETGPGSISGSREDLLILIEAARRDLNACAQAAGASNEWKTRYGKLGDELGANCHRYDVPRVDLMAREPFAAGAQKVADPALDWSTEQEIAATAGMLEPEDEDFDIEGLLG